MPKLRDVFLSTKQNPDTQKKRLARLECFKNTTDNQKPWAKNFKEQTKN